jgi:hypothetical protein
MTPSVIARGRRADGPVADSRAGPAARRASGVPTSSMRRPWVVSSKCRRHRQNRQCKPTRRFDETNRRPTSCDDASDDEELDDVDGASGRTCAARCRRVFLASTRQATGASLPSRSSHHPVQYRTYRHHDIYSHDVSLYATVFRQLVDQRK